MPTQKLSSVLEFGAKSAASVARSTSFTQKRIKALGSTISDNTKEAARLRREMKKHVKNGKVVNSVYFEQRRRVEDLERANAKLERRQKRLRMVNRGVKRSFGAIGKVAKNVMVGLGAAAVGAAAGMTRLLLSTASYGDELAKTSRRLGVSVESLDKLRFIAERSGVETPVLEKSIQKVQIALGEAARNVKGPYAQAFRELGVNFRKFSKLEPDEQMVQLADAFSSLTSQTEKTFLANRLWGEEGIKMLQIVEAGGDGVRQLGDDFNRLGGSMGTSAAESAEAFQDSMTNLKQSGAATFRLLAAEALPKATAAMERFTELVQSGDIDIKAIGESLGQLIDLLVRGVEAAVKFAGALDRVGRGIGDRLARWFGGADFETTDRLELPPASQGVLASGASAGPVTVNQTINAAPGMSEEQIANASAAAIQREQAAAY